MRYRLLIIFAGVALMNVASQMLYKRGVGTDGVHLSVRGVFAIFTNPYVLGGMCVQVVSMVAWLFVLASVRVAVAIPVLYGSIFVLLVPVSWRLFGETIGVYESLGIMMIFIGICLIATRMGP